MSADRSGAGMPERRAEKIEVPGASIEAVVCPASVAQLEALLRSAAEAHTPFLIAGGRTRLDLANPASSIRTALSLESLSGVLEFEPDEGVLHVAAGTPLALIREIVAQEGWELPLDSPGPNTTVGGTIASAVTGPRAQAFGPVSDAILGLGVVGGDGVASKCGGRVVKNVTGYDLAKLYCGSFGSLAVITSAWLRLRPAAEQRVTLRLGADADRAGFERVRELATLNSVRALIWREDDAGHEVVVELGGSSEGVAHDRGRLAEAFALEEVEPGRVDTLRDARTTAGLGGDDVALRVRVLGSSAEAMRTTLRASGLEVSVDPGLGVLHARGRVGDVGVLHGLRSRAEQGGGFATFEGLPDAWRGEVDVFGPLGGTEALHATLARRFDPAGILNPGRFVRSVDARRSAERANAGAPSVAHPGVSS